MPGWKEHLEYCKKFGVAEAICDFANRLIDFPEEYILKHCTLGVRAEISKRLGIPAQFLNKALSDTEELYAKKRDKYCEEYCSYRSECKQRRLTDPILFTMWHRDTCPLNKTSPHAISHSKLHDPDPKYDDFRAVAKEIMRYHYGEDGIKAIDLHFELDEALHVTKYIKDRIVPCLQKNIKGSIYINREKRYLPNSALVRRYVYKNHTQLLKILKRTGNLSIFSKNLAEALSMEVTQVVPGSSDKFADKKIAHLLDDYGDMFKNLKKIKEMLELN